MNTLSALQNLARTRPGLDADDAEVAAWHENRADVLRALADEPGTDTAALLAAAIAAYERAASLGGHRGPLRPAQPTAVRALRTHHRAVSPTRRPLDSPGIPAA